MIELKKMWDDLEDPFTPSKPKENIEYKIQVAIVEHVRGKEGVRKAFNVFVCHIYNGRSAEEGFFLKMLGVFAGVADLLVLWRSKCECGKSKIGVGFLEVKKLDGTQSTAQRKFEGICNWLGIPYAIVRSVQEAHDQLLKWKCPVNHHVVVEPDTRTQEEKKKDNFNFFKS